MIVGHQKQWQFLKKSAELGRLPHALLFSGQSQLGKKTIAREFIKLLNCQNQNFEVRPCQSCRNCKSIQKGIYPDLKEIQPKGREIQISQIRELEYYLSLRPYSAPLKTAIIDRAHLMNQEAQNAFLKTLEEPKGETLLILITETVEQLLPTIFSRTEKVKFYPVSFSEIENYLRLEGVSESNARKLALLSFGRPGIALNFLLDPKKLESQNQKIKEILKISSSDLSLRFQYAKDLSQNPQNLKEILDIWLRYFRNTLLTKIGSKIEIDNRFKNYSIQKLRNILRVIQNINYLLSTTNVNPRLALEILMLEF